MKLKTKHFILIIIGIIILFYISENYYKFKYGMRFNNQREKLEIIEIPENWYNTANDNGELRFSRTKTTKELSLYLDSVGFKGYIDKFIFLNNEHYEEDVFIEVKENDTNFYRSFYYFSNAQRKCTLNNEAIDCNIIDSLFVENVN